MLDNENFINYAMRHYDNPRCRTINDFNEDLNRIIHIKKLLNRIISNEEINLRLVLNHFVTFFNMFDNHAAVAILFFKIEEDKWCLLKTFLDYLNYTPEEVDGVLVNLKDIHSIKYIQDELKTV